MPPLNRRFRTGAAAASLEVDVDNTDARRLYERLGYTVVAPHEHRWRAEGPVSGAVIREGKSETWAMRTQL